jgi:hypothetical protein
VKLSYCGKQLDGHENDWIELDFRDWNEFHT